MKINIPGTNYTEADIMLIHELGDGLKDVYGDDYKRLKTIADKYYKRFTRKENKQDIVEEAKRVYENIQPSMEAFVKRHESSKIKDFIASIKDLDIAAVVIGIIQGGLLEQGMTPVLVTRGGPVKRSVAKPKKTIPLELKNFAGKKSLKGTFRYKNNTVTLEIDSDVIFILFDKKTKRMLRSGKSKKKFVNIEPGNYILTTIEQKDFRELKISAEK